MQILWLTLLFGLGFLCLICLLWSLALLCQGQPAFLAILALAFIVGISAWRVAEIRNAKTFENKRAACIERNPQIRIGLAKTDAEINELQNAVATMEVAGRFGSSEESRKFARGKIAHAHQNIQRLTQSRAALITEIEKQLVLGAEQSVESELATNAREEALTKTTQALQEAEAFRQELQAH